MKFSSREDLKVPIEAAFEMICDFRYFERMAIRRGADVVRLDDLSEPGTGMKWQVNAPMRGKYRDVTIEMITFEPPTGFALQSMSQGLIGISTVELLALSRSSTRLAVALDMKPQSLSARLLIQSLKLAKAPLVKRYKARVADYALHLDERYRLQN